MHIKALLTQQIEAAFADLGLQGSAVIQAASRPEFGDYQANGVMAVAKRAGLNPRDVAADVIAKLSGDADFAAMVSAMEVAGPGFINITLAPLLFELLRPRFSSLLRRPLLARLLRELRLSFLGALRWRLGPVSEAANRALKRPLINRAAATATAKAR